MKHITQSIEPTDRRFRILPPLLPHDLGPRKQETRKFRFGQFLLQEAVEANSSSNISLSGDVAMRDQVRSAETSATHLIHESYYDRRFLQSSTLGRNVRRALWDRQAGSVNRP